MSSLNDTLEEDEAEYLHFPSQASNRRLLCLKGRDMRNGSRNSYSLAWPGNLPEQAVLLKGLTFVSDSYYDYKNLWHGFNALTPFIRWSMKNGCAKSSQWILYHWGELRDGTGSWVQHLMEAIYGELRIERFEGRVGDGSYCFEEAVVMRHNMGRMGKEKKLKLCDLLRCKASEPCGVKGGNVEVNDRGDPLITLTLLMRRGSRSFKNASAVIDVFAKECERVSGCQLKVVQSEELSFCDQVRVMSGTDIVVSPHGGQLTNMLFMDRGSSVMEFFPRGWLEYAGVGRYAHHWMADQSGMKPRGAWWEPLGNKDCPNPKDDIDCFQFYKGGKVGHNETHFAKWAKDVLNQVSISKRGELSAKRLKNPSLCAC
ncbi:hypothetical protein CRG98_006138 [Punica granatum]|nr:hypothetical protein CRG98_006138 [Punica granatum]